MTLAVGMATSIHPPLVLRPESCAALGSQNTKTSAAAMTAGADDRIVKVAPALERVGDFAAFLGESFDEAQRGR